MAHRGFLPWWQRGPIHANLRQPKALTQLTLFARHHARAIGLRVTRPGAAINLERIQRRFGQRHGRLPHFPRRGAVFDFDTGRLALADFAFDGSGLDDFALADVAFTAVTRDDFDLGGV